MPSKKFWAYVTMMKVLKAQDAIATINMMSYAFGSMRKEVGQQYSFALNTASTLASRRPRRTAVRPTSPAQLAGFAGGSTAVILEPGPQEKARLRAEAAAREAEAAKAAAEVDLTSDIQEELDRRKLEAATEENRG